MCLDILYKSILDLYYMELLNKSELQQQKETLQNSVYGRPGFLSWNWNKSLTVIKSKKSLDYLSINYSLISCTSNKLVFVSNPVGWYFYL